MVLLLIVSSVAALCRSCSKFYSASKNYKIMRFLFRIIKMVMTIPERVAIVRLYYKNGNSPSLALREYGRETGNYELCSKRAVNLLIRKFENTGSVEDAKSPGRPKMDEDHIIEVSLANEMIASRDAYHLSSTRKISSEIGMPTTSVWRALRKALKKFPYRIRRLHELKPQDHDRRLAFAQDFLTRVEIRPRWFDSILWSDEAHFTLSGQVNRWNARIWSDETPHSFIQVPLHAAKVTVWCGLTLS